MTTSIQLGNIFTDSSGSTRVSGGQSGFDIEGLVESLSEAKRLPAVQIEAKLEQNTAKMVAYEELRSLTSTFLEAANFLRNPPGVQNEADNIFEYRAAQITSSIGGNAESYMSITAEPGTPIGEFAITVDQIAERNVKTTETFTITPVADQEDEDQSIVGSGGPFNAGTLTLGPNGTTVELEDGDSLNQVLAKVNAASEESNVEASYIKVSDGNYRLSFKTDETGSAMNYDIVADNTASGVLNTTFVIEQNGQDAQMTIDGTQITRTNNDFDDVIDGMTFNLTSETPIGEELQVKIEADSNLAKQGIINFVETYNAVKLFASQQTEIGEDGTPEEAAILSGDSTLRLILSRINNELSQQVKGIAGDDFSRLSDLGITFSDYEGDDEFPYTRNILTLDEDALDSALSTDFEGVRDVFEFNSTSDNADFQIFERSNGLAVTEYSVNVDVTNGTYTATYDLNGASTTVSLDGNILTDGTLVLNGQSGTALDGMTMLFSSPTDTVINIMNTQGLGDRLYNTLEGLLEEGAGAIDVVIQSMQDDEERFNSDIETIDARVERYREQLITTFSALEAAIAQSNTLLQALDANSNAANN